MSPRDVIVVAGVRTPFVKAGTDLGAVSAVELGRVALREAIERAEIDPDDLDEVVVGNVANPPEAANVARVNLRWSLSPTWSVTLNSMAESFRDDVLRHQSFTATQDRDSRSLNTSTQWSLQGELSHGTVKHRVLLGLDASRWRAVTNGVDIQDGGGPLKVDIRESKAAVLLQDEMSAGPLRLRAAVQRARTPTHDEFRQRLGNGVAIPPRNYLPVDATNWDAGLLYQLRPALSVYAGTQYSVESDLRAPGETLADGSTPPPTLLRQVQLGVKGESLDGRLSWTMEAFRLRETNVRFYAQGVAGAGRSVDGLELELAGRPGERLDLNLGWTYLRATDTPLGPDGFVVVPAGGVPRRSLHLLARYHLQGADGPGSTLGLAVHATSSTLVGPANFAPSQVVLPGGAQVDLSWLRSAGPWTFTAALRNAFDRSLYGTASDTRYIPLLPGRSIGLTATYKE